MILRRLLQLRGNAKGAVIVEMAMVAPVLATMIVGTIDLANAFNRKLAIEQAAQRSIEKVMNTTGESTVEQTIIDEAASQASVPSSNVTVTYRLECNGSVSQASSCNTGETQTKWLQVVVTDKYTPIFPLHFAGLNSDGTYHLSATAGMRIQ